MRNMRTAVKFLVYGLVIGLLFAPKSGEENRKDLMAWVSNAVKSTVSGGS